MDWWGDYAVVETKAGQAFTSLDDRVRRFLSLSLSLSLLWVTQKSRAANNRLEFADESVAHVHTLEPLYVLPNGTVEHTFRISNASSRPFEIYKVFRASPCCTKVNVLSPSPIKPGEPLVLQIVGSYGDPQGEVRWAVEISDSSTPPRVIACALQANVKRRLEIDPGKHIDLGEINDTDKAESTITLVETVVGDETPLLRHNISTTVSEDVSLRPLGVRRLPSGADDRAHRYEARWQLSATTENPGSAVHRVAIQFLDASGGCRHREDLTLAYARRPDTQSDPRVVTLRWPQAKTAQIRFFSTSRRPITSVRLAAPCDTLALDAIRTNGDSCFSTVRLLRPPSINSIRKVQLATNNGPTDVVIDCRKAEYAATIGGRQ